MSERSGEGVIQPGDFGFNLVSRRAWGAQESSFVPSITKPVKVVIGGFPQLRYAPQGRKWLGPSPTFEVATSEIKFIQKKDLLKYPDIKYNFLIAPNGIVFEGRGWEYVPTLPLKYKLLSHMAYYIMFIGDFKDAPPTEDFYKTREQLLRYGVAKNYISRKFLMYTMEHTIKSPYEPFDFGEKRVNISSI